jgi:hypothetical protein
MNTYYWDNHEPSKASNLYEQLVDRKSLLIMACRIAYESEPNKEEQLKYRTLITWLRTIPEGKQC